MRCPFLHVLAAGILLSAFVSLSAQDTRRVTEPKVPPSCVVLDAQLSAQNGVLSDHDEHAADTDRIQRAIDGCAYGKAVVLRAQGNRQIFLSGPLALRKGITLVVDAKTSLIASRDPRLFDLVPGSCGVVSEKGHGCKPLISVNDAPDSGIMGEGSIDGRGGATLLGQDLTWWDLAHNAKVTDQQQSVPWLIFARHSNGFILYKITLRNSPGFHVSVNQTDGFTA